jgi:hypothetical protein
MCWLLAVNISPTWLQYKRRRRRRPGTCMSTRHQAHIRRQAHVRRPGTACITHPHRWYVPHQHHVGGRYGNLCTPRQVWQPVHPKAGMATCAPQGRYGNLCTPRQVCLSQQFFSNFRHTNPNKSTSKRTKLPCDSKQSVASDKASRISDGLDVTLMTGSVSQELSCT